MVLKAWNKSCSHWAAERLLVCNCEFSKVERDRYTDYGKLQLVREYCESQVKLELAEVMQEI